MAKERYSIRPVPRTFEQVAQQLVDYIAAEGLEEGAKIPTERKLSELLGVSRSSVREGLRALELLSHLQSRQGEGTFVAEPSPFLLPDRVFQRPLADEALRHYYEIGLMCAERIVWVALRENVSGDVCTSPGDRFWPGFAAWVEAIASHLQNRYYLSLWLNICELLRSNQYFCHRPAPVQLNALITAYTDKDEPKLRDLFTALSRIE